MGMHNEINYFVLEMVWLLYSIKQHRERKAHSDFVKELLQ